DVEVDIWSTGCIFAEMLEGRPLFPGKDHVNQFSIITELLGTPPDDVIQTICSEHVRSPSSLTTGVFLTDIRPSDLSSPSPSVNARTSRLASRASSQMVRSF